MSNSTGTVPFQSLYKSFSFGGQTLPWNNYFQKLELLKSMNEDVSRGILTFVGVSPEMISKAALQASQNLKFKWGTGNNLSIPHEYVIHSIDVKYMGQMAVCALHLMDCRLHLMANSGFSAFPHQSFSQIVSSITQGYNKLPAAVVKADKYIQDVLHTGSNHWAFLSALKREGTKSQDKGECDYRLFWKGGNELHFHPPDYKQAAYRTITVFASSLAPEVNLRLNPWKAIVKGKDNYQTGQFLRDSGRPFSTQASQEGVGGATALHSNTKGAFPGKFFHSHHDVQEGLEKDAAVGAEYAVTGDGSLELTMGGDPGIEPGHLVNILFKDKASGEATQADGIWLVEHVYHHIHGDANGQTRIRVSRTSGTGGLGGNSVAGSGGSQYGGAASSGGQMAQVSQVT